MSDFIRPPGIYVFAMTAIWALPFAVRAIIYEPHEVLSNLFHIVFLGIPAITALILNLNNKINEHWSSGGIWTRIAIVWSAYLASSIATLLIIMDGGFSSGDAGGSYGLILLPSIVVYAVIGIIIGALMSLFTLYRKTKG